MVMNKIFAKITVVLFALAVILPVLCSCSYSDKRQVGRSSQLKFVTRPLMYWTTPMVSAVITRTVLKIFSMMITILMNRNSSLTP